MARLWFVQRLWVHMAQHQYFAGYRMLHDGGIRPSVFPVQSSRRCCSGNISDLHATACGTLSFRQPLMICLAAKNGGGKRASTSASGMPQESVPSCPRRRRRISGTRQRHGLFNCVRSPNRCAPSPDHHIGDDFPAPRCCTSCAQSSVSHCVTRVQFSSPVC